MKETITMYAIYDKKAEVHAVPYTAPNDAQAVRGFMDACKDEKSPLNNYAEDFVLVKLGYFDQKKGTFINQLEMLIEAKNVVNKNPTK